MTSRIASGRSERGSSGQRASRQRGCGESEQREQVRRGGRAASGGRAARSRRESERCGGRRERGRRAEWPSERGGSEKRRSDEQMLRAEGEPNAPNRYAKSRSSVRERIGVPASTSRPPGTAGRSWGCRPPPRSRRSTRTVGGWRSAPPRPGRRRQGLQGRAGRSARRRWRSWREASRYRDRGVAVRPPRGGRSQGRGRRRKRATLAVRAPARQDRRTTDDAMTLTREAEPSALTGHHVAEGGRCSARCHDRGPRASHAAGAVLPKVPHALAGVVGVPRVIDSVPIGSAGQRRRYTTT